MPLRGVRCLTGRPARFVRVSAPTAIRRSTRGDGALHFRPHASPLDHAPRRRPARVLVPTLGGGAGDRACLSHAWDRDARERGDADVARWRHGARDGARGAAGARSRAGALEPSLYLHQLLRRCFSGRARAVRPRRRADRDAHGRRCGVPVGRVAAASRPAARPTLVHRPAARVARRASPSPRPGAAHLVVRAAADVSA